MASGRGVVSALSCNHRDLQLECSIVLHEALLLPIPMYGSEIMLWKEKEIYRIRGGAEG